jgi:glucose-1-phosphate thymidylyltransferase
MKGIVLAGGAGTRLNPLTEVTNKHLLAVYNKPMIFHPLETLLRAGIKDIMFVTSGEHAGAFLRLLGSGERYGANFSFKIQEGSLGIAHAIGLCKDFAEGSDVAVILGDNIFEDDFSNAVQTFKSGAKIFLKHHDDPRRFGVPEIVDGIIVNIEEKPSNPKSQYAQTGLYMYDSKLFKMIEGLDYSERGELEVTDLNNKYIEIGELYPEYVNGEWTDAGTFESLHRANVIARKLSEKYLDREHSSIKNVVKEEDILAIKTDKVV